MAATATSRPRTTSRIFSMRFFLLLARRDRVTGATLRQASAIEKEPTGDPSGRPANLARLSDLCARGLTLGKLRRGEVVQIQSAVPRKLRACIADFQSATCRL